MSNTLSLEQKTTESGSSKTPIYGALIPAVASAGLMLVMADAAFPAILAAPSLELTATAPHPVRANAANHHYLP